MVHIPTSYICSLSMLQCVYHTQGSGHYFCEATLQDPHAALRAASSSETCSLVAMGILGASFQLSKSWYLMFKVGALCIWHFCPEFIQVLPDSVLYDLGQGKIPPHDLIFWMIEGLLQHPVVRFQFPQRLQLFRKFSDLSGLCCSGRIVRKPNRSQRETKILNKV